MNARQRARRWGRLVKWFEGEEGSYELRLSKRAGLTYIASTPDGISYAENLRPSEAALATIRWYSA